jgi:hypothetical protein
MFMYFIHCTLYSMALGCLNDEAQGEPKLISFLYTALQPVWALAAFSVP